MGMNERDPISEWEDAIGRRIGAASVVLLLLAFVCCLIAPVFGPFIKYAKLHEYVLFSDYERRAEEDMKVIRPLLWIVAIVSWIIFIICHMNYP